MSIDKSKKESPKTETLFVELDILRGILHKGIYEYIGYLQKNWKYKEVSKTIVRPIERGMRWVALPFPVYPRFLSDIDEDFLNLDSIKAFFSYVESRSLIVNYSRRCIPDERNAREDFFVINIHDPLMNLFADLAMKQVVTSGSIKDQWMISHNYIDQFTNELAKRFCHGRKQFVALCPLAWFELSPGTTIDFGCGMILHSYDEIEKAFYLSYTNEYSIHGDFISKPISSDVVVLELNGCIDTVTRHQSDGIHITEEDFVKQQIVNKLDMFKWAVVTALNCNTPPIEGTIVYGDLYQRSKFTIRREFKNQGTVFTLNADRIDSIKDLISKISTWIESSNDIKSSLWHWSRAALSDLDRDKLLESVIGLESLLVTDSNNLRYRFGLNGASLLADTEDGVRLKAKKLQKIYDKRSSIAHGGSHNVCNDARETHKILGDLIRIILDFYSKERMCCNKTFAEQLDHEIHISSWRNFNS